MPRRLTLSRPPSVTVLGLMRRPPSPGVVAPSKPVVVGGMTAEVKAARRWRPRLVHTAEGFVRMEVPLYTSRLPQE